MLARLGFAAVPLMSAAVFAQVPASAPATPALGPVATTTIRAGLNHSVLEQLAERYGFIIITKDSSIFDHVALVIDGRTTPDEALAALNSALESAGYTTITSRLAGPPERTIVRIVTLQEAKDHQAADVRVFEGADPEKIEASDRIITQIIPLKTIDAVRLRADLLPLISPQATVTANGAANCIIIIDTAINVRKLVQIIAALDKTSTTQNEVRTLHLQYSNAGDASRLINDVFNPQNNQVAPAAASPAGGPSAATQGAGRIFASSDARTNTVVITGPKAAVDQAVGLLSDNDKEGGGTIIFKVDLENAPATSVAPVVQEVFDHTPGK